MLDCVVIVPRLQRLYEWSAEELADPRLLGLVRDGSPVYAWPFEQRHVWRPGHMPFAGRASNASRASPLRKDEHDREQDEHDAADGEQPDGAQGQRRVAPGP